ncbi:hypothetical protein ACFVHB_26820 [Kitasatospora sp. NPDC127111]|uniref:hypothetical protein n=1 Tax=Kitasatospora sp. NPDC127111 TaxID=3345363 RepID=UPI00363A1CEE
MSVRMQRWLLLGAATAAVSVLATAATSTLATADTPPPGPVESAAPLAVEDGAYPDADVALQDLGVTVTRGDGRITLTGCNSAYEFRIDVRPRLNNQGHVCFAAPYTTGNLTISIPEAYGIRTMDRSVRLSYTLDGKTNVSMDVPKNVSKGFGEGAGKTDQAVVVDIHVTG